MFCAERSEQMNLYKTDFLAFGGKIIDDFPNGAGNGSHGDNNAVSVWRAVVVKQMVSTSGDFGKGFHVIVYNSWQSVVERVVCLANLEIDVSVLNRRSQARMFRIERLSAECVQSFVVNQRQPLRVIDQFHLAHFVRRSEPVEEVHKRNSSFNCRQMSDRRQVHNLLS